MNSETKDQEKKFACPYLGVYHDPGTAMAFPTPQNSCHKITLSMAPSEVQQSQYCLSANFAECEVYKWKGKASGKKFPAIFNLSDRPFKKNSYIFIFLALLLLIMGYAIYKIISRGGFFSNIPADATEAASMPTWVEPTIIFEETPSPTETPFTLDHTPIPKKQQKPPKFIETPMGINSSFIVHRVLPGESLASLAETYHTTVEIIQTLNYGMGDTLWLDKLVVVPYDKRNVTELPPLTATLVEVDGITIDQFAADRFIEPNLLRRLNNLPRGYQLSLNEAIVIPYISP